MRRYEHVEVAGTLNVEETEDLLVGTEAEPKHVLGLHITEMTATQNDDAVLRVYRNTERIVDMPLPHLLQDIDGSVRYFPPYIELDLDLGPGDKLIVGQVSGATASDIDFCAVWEELGR